jgi:hypothetical protein
MFRLKPIVSQAKATVRKHLFTVPVVLERSRLADQLVDDVPVIDGALVTPHQPRHRVDRLVAVPELDSFSVQPHLDLLSHQAAVNAVGVALHLHETSRVDTRRQPQHTVESRRRQRLQGGEFLGVAIGSRHIPKRHDLLKKGRVLVPAGEVPAAAQQQGLIHGVLEVSVRRFGIAVLMRLAHIDPLADQTVMREQSLIPRLKLALRRQVVDRGAQAVAAMAAWHAAQLPQRVLQSFRQRLERLRRTDRHRFPVRVGQDEVVHEMLESSPGNRDSQRIHAGEVRRPQVSSQMDLAEHHFTLRARDRPPPLHAALERSPMTLRKLTRAFSLQPVKQRLRLQPRFDFQPLLYTRPHFRKRIEPGAVGPHQRLLGTR